jgi:hypothetical protein
MSMERMTRSGATTRVLGSREGGGKATASCGVPIVNLCSTAKVVEFQTPRLGRPEPMAMLAPSGDHIALVTAPPPWSGSSPLRSISPAGVRSAADQSLGCQSMPRVKMRVPSGLKRVETAGTLG